MSTLQTFNTVSKKEIKSKKNGHNKCQKFKNAKWSKMKCILQDMLKMNFLLFFWPTACQISLKRSKYRIFNNFFMTPTHGKKKRKKKNFFSLFFPVSTRGRGGGGLSKWCQKPFLTINNPLTHLLIFCNKWHEMPYLERFLKIKGLTKILEKKNPPPPLPTSGRLLKRSLNVFYR